MQGSVTAGLGLNFGHDAGVGVATLGGMQLIEMERVVGVRHACGGEPGVREALGESLRAHLLDPPAEPVIGVLDYRSPRATYVEGVIDPPVIAGNWECHGVPRADQLVRSLQLPPGFMGLPPEIDSGFLVRHHWAHASLAYHTSPFDEALVVCLDGTGCFADCGIVCAGVGAALTPICTFTNIFGPRFGLVYESFARTVFGNQFDTGKLLGLSAYGTPRPELVPLIQVLHASNRFRRANPWLLDPVPNGALECINVRYGRDWLAYDPDSGGYLDARCRTYADFLDGFGRRFPDAVNIGGRIDEFCFDADDALCRDLAATIQQVFETNLLRLLTGLARRFPTCRNLCYAGGCALNINANSRVLAETPFERVYVPSCCDDSGVALGAALAVSPVARSRARGSRHAEIDLAFAGAPLRGTSQLSLCAEAPSGAVRSQVLDADALIATAARLLARGRVLGWIEGAVETGPRALGHRSVLASPLRPGVRHLVSEVLKGREPFRPVAPICTVEALSRFFDGPLGASPTMLFSFRVRPAFRQLLAEVTHVDGSARVQTASRPEMPSLHTLLEAFAQETGVPVLLNTSLNGQGRPIINCVEEAFELLQSPALDGLVFKDANLIFLKEQVENPG